MLFIVLFSLLCMALFALIGLFWWLRKHLGLPNRGRLGRIAAWAEGVRKSEAEVKTATVGDLVLFVTLYVIGVTFVITLYIWFNAGAEDKYKQESEQLRQKVGNLDSQLHDEEKELAQLRNQQAEPGLIVPGADDQIIGKHVDLRWQYGNHNRNTDYVLQFVRISGPVSAPSETHDLWRGDESQIRQLDLGVPCTVAATDSADQRSRFPNRGFLPEGTYIWRVAVGGLNAAAPMLQDCADDDRIREWSAYRKFTLYPTQLERTRFTGEILVGTRFVQNIPFTRIGDEGRPTGFDMDLIKVMLERCLVEDVAKGVRYDHAECEKGVTAFLSDSKAAEYLPANHLRARIVPFAPGIDWLGKLQAKNIDLYIGSVTRAKDREHGEVAFTDGYLNYTSEALVEKSESCSSIACLADKAGSVGVVENTTNAWLANELLKDDKLKDLNIVTYKSFPELESAFERRDVVSVITDGIMASTMGITEPKRLGDLRKNSGWKTYLKQRIGYSQEQFAIAVANDAQQDEALKTQLRKALNCALRDRPVQVLIHTLYHKYNLEGLGTSLAEPAARCLPEQSESSQPESWPPVGWVGRIDGWWGADATASFARARALVGMSGSVFPNESEMVLLQKRRRPRPHIS